MKNDIAVKLTNVSKRYYLHSEKPTFVENLNPFKKPEEFWALKDINLTIKKGEQIGLIGNNGSGKTTLLKIIAGITKPTTGTIETHGKIVSLIELTAGFHPEMNGIDNIYINAMLLGMSKAEITSKISKIISFADIGPFINQPLYTYSSGMSLRLGFSIALHSQPETLILDESISVGDKQFRQKIASIIKDQQHFFKTIIIASNLDEIIKKYTQKITILENGVLQQTLFLEKNYTNKKPERVLFDEFLLLQETIKVAPLTLKIQGTSMFPHLEHNSRVTVKYVPFESIKKMDIIAYYEPISQLLIAHRVIMRPNTSAIIAAGDNNIFQDEGKISEGNYLGLITTQ